MTYCSTETRRKLSEAMKLRSALFGPQSRPRYNKKRAISILADRIGGTPAQASVLACRGLLDTEGQKILAQRVIHTLKVYRLYDKCGVTDVLDAVTAANQEQTTNVH
ncbi:MAG TPA: hypothetical protein VFJ58_17265 [Armatimonadota bacterium]|nr:hypothetical protein [Armatimonadota bacterium]